MSNPTQEYNDYIRANLPLGITYDEVRARYVTDNGKYFPTYLEAKWYLDYIIKFGFIPSPASLFANGEQGAWYDPSDLTTLYQDAAGTTPVTADGDPVGLMLDKHLGGTFEARRNLLQYSEAFDNWGAGNLTVSVNEIADPKGNVTADFLVPSMSSGYHRVRVSGVLVDNSTSTLSVYAKTGGYDFLQLRFENAGGAYQNFNIANGTIEAGSGTYNAEVKDVGNGWFRVSASSDRTTHRFDGVNIVIVESATSGDLESFSGDGTSGIYIWGAQVENSATLTDYQPVEEYPTSWPNGNHATQPTAAARPVYRTDGTLHWLEFDGVDDALTATTAATDLIDAGIAVAIGSITSESQQLFRWVETNNESQNRLNISPRYGGASYFDAFNTGGGRIAGPTSITGTVVSLGNADGSSRVVRQNGVEVLSGTSSDTGIGLDKIEINDSSELMNFYGGLILSRAFTHSNITSIESYLASKSGVTL